MSGRYQILPRNREITRAYLKEAAADVNSAKLLIAGTEHPFFGRPDLPIWIPSECYDRADAEDALAKAKYVFGTVGALLREAHEV